jgi:hypothetical protein
MPSFSGKYGSATPTPVKFEHPGSVEIEGQEGLGLPIYGFDVLSGLGEVVAIDRRSFSALPLLLTSDQARGLAVYYSRSTGLFLAPRGWRPVHAAEGVNGSYGVVMIPDDPRDASAQWISLRGIPACAGCIVTSAVPFFPRARREARESYNFVFSGFDVPVSKAYLSPNVVALSYQARREQYRTHAIAVYISGGDQEFHDMYVTLPAGQKSLATAILNFRAKVWRRTGIASSSPPR